MKVLGKKKKQRTDQQKVRRGAYALGFVVLMVFAVFLGPRSRKNEQKEDPLKEIAAEMDAQLDGLLYNECGGPAEVFFKGDIGQVPFTQYLPEADALDSLQFWIRMYENSLLPYADNDTELKEARREEERLKAKIAERENSAAGNTYYFSRRIRYTNTVDGKKYTCFQEYFLGAQKLRYVITLDPEPGESAQQIEIEDLE